MDSVECTAASAPSVWAELPSAWEEASSECSESFRWLKANVWSWPSTEVATKDCTGRPRLSQNETIQFQDIFFFFADGDDRDGWRKGGLFTLRPSDVAGRPREFYCDWIKFKNQQTRF
jgi:hypothetical protein